MPSIQELQLLNYALENKDVTPLTEVPHEYFNVHGDIYDYVVQFAKDNGVTPSTDTVLNKFEEFIIVEPEKVDVVVEALKEDWLARQAEPLLVNASKKVGEFHTLEALEELKREATNLLNLAGTSSEAYSYVGNAEKRKQDYLKIHGRTEDEVMGITTGFRNIDLATNGIESGKNGIVDYFLVIAPTNMGKTLFTSAMVANGWGANDAWEYPAYFSLEQTAAEIAYNWDNQLAHVARLGITRGTLNERQKDEYVSFLDSLKKKTKDIKIYDMSYFKGRQPTVDQIRNVLEREKHTFFALDQLSKVRASTKFGELRHQFFNVSSEVRSMILSLGIPGYIVAQTNRDAAKKVKKDSTAEVTSEDVGEAYSIVQDASKAISVVKVDDNTFRLTVIKNRGNGSGQTELVRYDFNTGMFQSLNEDSGEQYF